MKARDAGDVERVSQNLELCLVVVVVVVVVVVLVVVVVVVVVLAAVAVMVVVVVVVIVVFCCCGHKILKYVFNLQTLSFPFTVCVMILPTNIHSNGTHTVRCTTRSMMKGFGALYIKYCDSEQTKGEYNHTGNFFILS